MSRSYEESRTQREIIVHFRKHYAGRIVHVANGGKRSAVEAIRLKAEGVEAGHPDLIIYQPGPRVYLIEVKASDGTVSKAQRDFISDLHDMLFDVAEVRSLDEAKRLFAEVWKLKPRMERPRSEVEMRTGF